MTVPTVIIPGATPVLNSELTAEITLSVTPSTSVAESCTRGDESREMETGGQIRQYLLHVPAMYKPEEAAAMVLVFHGARISAERFVDYTRFSKGADREGFLIVYPQGQGSKEEPF